MSDVVLSSPMRANLLSLNQTERSIDRTSLRLATGLKVNSALDNPQNFFAASSLRAESSELSKLIDGITQSTRTIQEADHGVAAISKLLDQGEAIVEESKRKLRAGETDSAIYPYDRGVLLPSYQEQALQDSPNFYYPLNDTAFLATNMGSSSGNFAVYLNGVDTLAPALYSNQGTTSADFDGIDDRMIITDHPDINSGGPYPERTVELIFNADDVTSRQTLYEDGGDTIGFNIYIYNGQLHITGTDSVNWGPGAGSPNNLNTPITVGETYHVAFVFSSAENRFEAYVNGTSIGSVTVGNTAFPTPNISSIGVAHTFNGAWYDDLSVSFSTTYFNGRISDVAIYNDALSDERIQAHFEAMNQSTLLEYRHSDYENILNQIDMITEDASYRGVNLLAGDNLTTNFNANRSNSLTTQGVDFTADGLGLKRYDFNNLDDLDEILTSIREARNQVRAYGRSLASNINIIKTRDEYTRSKINTLEAGADDLTVADQNEEGANMLALQTRQQLGITSLSLASQSEQSVLRLF